MTEKAIALIKGLPAYCERNSIYKADTMYPHFSIGWAEGLVRYFAETPAARSVTYRVELYDIPGGPYDAELEVMRDGFHALRMAHDPA